MTVITYNDYRIVCNLLNYKECGFPYPIEIIYCPTLQRYGSLNTDYGPTWYTTLKATKAGIRIWHANGSTSRYKWSKRYK